MKCEYCGDENCESQDCIDSKYEAKAIEFFSRCKNWNKDFCPGDCEMIITCMDYNHKHRVKRSLVKIVPGEPFTVDGVEYNPPKKACVNCKHFGFRQEKPFCSANHNYISISKIDIPRDDCDFWGFKVMEERKW